jgi:8-oxo-dGTP diphosphatase
MHRVVNMNDDAHLERLTEEEFLERYRPEAYARPSVAVDVVLVSVAEGALWVHGVRREAHPHRGRFALPGTFVREDERLEVAAARVLREKAGLARVFLEQLYTFGAPRRDPRMRVISVAYLALLTESELAERHSSLVQARVEPAFAGLEEGGVALEAAPGDPIACAFDHEAIIATAVRRLRGKLDYAPVGYRLLPRAFTLLELQRVHEIILGRAVNKDSFRRRMLATGELEATGVHEAAVGHRPAELYRYAPPAHERAERSEKGRR